MYKFRSKQKHKSDSHKSNILFRPDIFDLSVSQFVSSVAQLCLTLCDPKDRSMPGPLSITNSRSPPRPISRWCHPTISSSVVLFSSWLHSFPASGSFPMSQLFPSGSQSIGASASVLPVNIQGWFFFRFDWFDLLEDQGTLTVPKHQFFDTQPSLWPNSHIHTWILEKP